MKAIRKSDGKVIEVYPTPYFNMKTDEECRRCLSDGKHYKLSDLDFSVNETKNALDKQSANAQSIAHKSIHLSDIKAKIDEWMNNHTEEEVYEFLKKHGVIEDAEVETK